MIIILIIITISIFLMIAFFIIAERKLLASKQHRRDPNVTGFWGVLQIFTGGLLHMYHFTIQKLNKIYE